MKIETLVQLFSCEVWEISKNTFSYRTPTVAASENEQYVIFKPINNILHRVKVLST